jgi:endonuclease-3
LGFLGARSTDRAAHTTLTAAVPPSLRYGFHVNSVAHGRAVCTKLNPACDRCPLLRLCPWPGCG